MQQLFSLYFPASFGYQPVINNHNARAGTPCSIDTLPAGFAEAYTISGCSDSAHCGVFRRVLARCASGDASSGHALGACGNDPSLCDGVPVYQQEGGGEDAPVLLRAGDEAITIWAVAASSALETCSLGLGPSSDGPDAYLVSATGFHETFTNSAGVGPPPEMCCAGPPNTAVYSNGYNSMTDEAGWVDIDSLTHGPVRCTSRCVSIVVGGR